jgi:CBS domain-containing protein
MSIDDDVAPHPKHGLMIDAMIEPELVDSPEAEVDPTYRVSKLAAANNPPIYVSPDSDKREAVTLMLINDFSQLPVRTSDTDVKGVISWNSIGTRLALGKGGSSVKDLMDSHYETPADASIFQAIPIIAMQQYVLVRGVDKRISGIVTATDLSLQFQLLTEPFLRLGEIENHIRLILCNKFSNKELVSISRHGSKEINSVADLTYGDYIHLLENEDRFAKLKIPIDRKTFCGQLDKVRRIRNDVMHFDLDGIPSSDLGLLRDFARFLRRLRTIGVPK